MKFTPVREPKEKVSNGVNKEGLAAERGFSCLVKVENAPKVLFDAGAGKVIEL